MRARTTFLAALFVTSLAGAAQAKQVKYVGVHPVAVDAGGGFCYIEVPHVHIYTPAKQEVLYREHDGGHFFVGDPVPYGYDGPKHAYYGHHPVPVDVILDEGELDGDEVEYCYLDGAHYHYYVPAASTKFVLKGGVYFFAGDLPTAYVEPKPRLIKINAVYKPLRYARPVLVEAPPPEYRGVIVEAAVTPVVVETVPAEPAVVAPVGARGEVHVGGPMVHGHIEVAVPVPTIEVRVPAVVVEERVDVVHVHEHKVKVKKHKHKHKHKKFGRGHWGRDDD